jgi:L-Ala-D/L-Glu epimerase
MGESARPSAGKARSMKRPTPELSVQVERWPLKSQLHHQPRRQDRSRRRGCHDPRRRRDGRGECVPYARYGETVPGVLAAIAAFTPRIAEGMTATELQKALPPGAARNALDCALWDLEAKRAGRRVMRLAGLPAPEPVLTAFTISLDTPEAMAQAASRQRLPLLKFKLGAEGDPERLLAVRKAVPDATLIVDANEGWNAGNLAENLAACAGAKVQLIEQPLPADDDAALASVTALRAGLCRRERARPRASPP